MSCKNCIEKQQTIDRLEQEVEHLKSKLNYQRKKEQEGYFGSSTPSSKVPVKQNTPKENQTKKRGAKKGHKGYGRKKVSEDQADKVEYLYYKQELCPVCKEALEKKGYQGRTVIDTEDNKSKKILYKCEKKRCPHCRKTYSAKPHTVFEKALYGNNLLAQACIMHYVHGIPMGRIEALMGENISPGSLFSAFHKIAGFLKSAEDLLIQDYRTSMVKHADETGWRTDGKSGYAWIFCTEDTTIFQFKTTRASSVPRTLFGEKELPGVLVVDRYAGYNRLKCNIQYCYAHLLRMVEDLGKEFEDKEVQTFVSHLSYYLSEAMHLRNLDISDTIFYEKAKEIKQSILEIINSPANHLGIRNIQNIFKESHERLYHWADSRKVPADNNRAERELRPTVIARKVSFGSQSAQGARTRSILMTYLHTAAKRIKHIPLENWFAEVLNKIVKNPDINCYDLLNINDSG